MNFCPNCGSALENGSLPCAACGFTEPVVVTGVDNTVAPVPALPKKRRKIVLTAVIAFSAILLCVGGFFLFRFLTTPDYVRAAEASLKQDQDLLPSIGVEVKTIQYLATYSTEDSYLVFFLVNPDSFENNVVAVQLDPHRKVVPLGYSAYSVAQHVIPDMRRGVAEFALGEIYHHSF